MFGESRCQIRRTPKLFMPKHNKLAPISLSERELPINRNSGLFVFAHKICSSFQSSRRPWTQTYPWNPVKTPGPSHSSLKLIDTSEQFCTGRPYSSPTTFISFLPDAWKGATPQREVAENTSQSHRSLRIRITVGAECHFGIATFVSGEQFSRFVFSRSPPPPLCVQVFPLTALLWSPCAQCVDVHGAGLTGLPCHIFIIMLENSVDICVL